eukprot:TRINITY_DN7976_c0_g1_i2.p1 TRINITY_DN7976_c0_g1~~TRINITY_DN7976_c0_g1_i2.p1  ORF type:complete len:322 (-),score=70.90 TRINITY_DN7976_c0_g1_i2:552-1403(-)
MSSLKNELDNKVEPARVLAEVIESKDPAGLVKKGQLVNVETGWQLYGTCSAREATVINDKTLPVTTTLGILGLPGILAYFGLLKLGKPKVGEVVVVSGAAGAVGSIVVQLARIKGCYVVGIAGSQKKIDYLCKELGCNVGIVYKNYKNSKEITEAISKVCPNGIDIYYDNVGGIITDAIWELININARIIICGQISHYKEGINTSVNGPRFLHHVLAKRAIIRGVWAKDWIAKTPEMMVVIKRWLLEDKIKYSETIIEGFENLPKALADIFEGLNTGKMIVKV